MYFAVCHFLSVVFRHRGVKPIITDIWDATSCIVENGYLYSREPHNDVSVNDGMQIRRWSHNIII